MPQPPNEKRKVRRKESDLRQNKKRALKGEGTKGKKRSLKEGSPSAHF